MSPNFQSRAGREFFWWCATCSRSVVRSPYSMSVVFCCKNVVVCDTILHHAHVYFTSTLLIGLSFDPFPRVKKNKAKTTKTKTLDMKKVPEKHIFIHYYKGSSVLVVIIMTLNF